VRFSSYSRILVSSLHSCCTQDAPPCPKSPRASPQTRVLTPRHFSKPIARSTSSKHLMTTAALLLSTQLCTGDRLFSQLSRATINIFFSPWRPKTFSGGACSTVRSSALPPQSPAHTLTGSHEHSDTQLHTAPGLHCESPPRLPPHPQIHPQLTLPTHSPRLLPTLPRQIPHPDRRPPRLRPRR
jgi:hypothetical protein